MSGKREWREQKEERELKRREGKRKEEESNMERRGRKGEREEGVDTLKWRGREQNGGRKKKRRTVGGQCLQTAEYSCHVSWWCQWQSIHLPLISQSSTHCGTHKESLQELALGVWW